MNARSVNQTFKQNAISLAFLVCISGTGLKGADFNAHQFGNPLLWMDAAEGVTSDGGTVQEWRDRTGSTTLARVEGVSQPTLTTGLTKKPAVEFATETRLLGTFSGDIAEDATLVLVAEVYEDPDHRSGFGGLMMFSYQLGFSVNRGTGTLALFSRHAPAAQDATEEIKEKLQSLRSLGEPNSLFGPVIIVASLSAKQATITVNGEVLVDFPKGLLTPMQSPMFSLASNAVPSATTSTPGKYYEAILFETALSEDKRKSLEKALGEKYGISIRH